MTSLVFQQELPPEISNIYGTADYHKFRDTFFVMDKILYKTGLENDLVLQALEKLITEKNFDREKFLNSKKAEFYYKYFRYALRCNIARHLIGDSYRDFSIRLADGLLFQWFTGISVFGERKAVSKSTLDRYEKCFDEELVANKVREHMAKLSNPDKANTTGLNEAIDFKDVFMDSTCIKANIHFPVDWVLLRDAARSLLLAIITIRAQGLKNRMIEPTQFLKNMNRLCIEMTHTRRKKDSKKHRKEILRKMKKLANCIRKHAERYRKLLIEKREKTDWTEAQAAQVIKRIDNILGQLPVAIHQAHERIIGERLLTSKEKILSLYDSNAQIIVRGKSESEVEFGQGFLLAEQKNGLIIDWEVFPDTPKADSKALWPSLERIQKYYGSVQSVCTDRGFYSKENEERLKEQNIRNALCPKNVKQLEENLSDPEFVFLQKRRSQTEARIGIFKNAFLGRPLRTRKIKNKQLAVTWCVLTHNLWVLARMSLANEKSKSKKAA